MHFNLISYVIIILSITSYIASTHAATECDDANSKSDNQYKFIQQAAIADIKWASDLARSNIDMVWQNLRDKWCKQEQLEGQDAFTPSNDSNAPSLRQFTGLYVFVSSSMPKPLLQSYLREASKYGGVLVFKGLPGGSFKELTKLVLELTSEQDKRQELASSMQIDDEAYERFEIVSVPTIVLSQTDDYDPTKVSVLKFDKMVGNVGVKYALTEFARLGELTKQALECLK
ncbi:MAG: type-F conjugative transfer system pilin assembly protein TrbC [Candidatus Tisiphia sp.]